MIPQIRTKYSQNYDHSEKTNKFPNNFKFKVIHDPHKKNFNEPEFFKKKNINYFSEKKSLNKFFEYSKNAPSKILFGIISL